MTININDVNDNAPTCTASANAVVVDEAEGKRTVSVILDAISVNLIYYVLKHCTVRFS